MINIYIADFNEWQVQESCSQSGGGPQQSEEKPAPEFVDDSHPPAYRGATYKQSLEANGGTEIDVQSSIDQLRFQAI